MTRKLLFVLATAALPSLLLFTVDSSVAQAARTNPRIHSGTITCDATNGGWIGTVKFLPPLSDSGTSNTEVLKIDATLGSAANPCVTSSAPSGVFGKIAGKLTLHQPAANNCATIFGGTPLTPVPTSDFKVVWHNPHGETPWTLPGFSISGTQTSGITITGGRVSGSFTPYSSPTATIFDTNWPTTVPGACTTSLASLSIGATSSGSW
jgi:hypothetical protein